MFSTSSLINCLHINHRWRRPPGRMCMYVCAYWCFFASMWLWHSLTKEIFCFVIYIFFFRSEFFFFFVFKEDYMEIVINNHMYVYDKQDIIPTHSYTLIQQPHTSATFIYTYTKSYIYECVYVCMSVCMSITCLV